MGEKMWAHVMLYLTVLGPQIQNFTETNQKIFIFYF